MRFFTVNKSTPCMICGKSDWCSLSEDGRWLICRRIDAGGRLKTDSSGGEYWVYSTDSEVDIKSVILPQIPDETDAPRADDDTLHRVYNTLLSMLTLSDHHHEQLLARGLSEETIERRSYRTLSSSSRGNVIPTLQKDYTEAQLVTVPGFFIERTGNSPKLAFGGNNGLIIPCTSTDNRIVALQVRLDRSGDGSKYRFVSSRKHGGPGPGTLAHIPPGYAARTDRVRITEGVLKADVATELTGLLTLSISGVSVWKAILPAIRTLGAEIAVLAFDADTQTNPHVARALRNATEGLRSEGLRVEIETWNIDRAKGIDDLLVLGETPELVSGNDVDDLVNRVVQLANAAAPTEEQRRFQQALAHASVIVQRAHSDPGAPFEQASLDSLSLVRSTSLPDWQRVRSGLRGMNVPARDLDKALVDLAKVNNGSSNNGHALYGTASDNGSKPSGVPEIRTDQRFMHEMTNEALDLLLPGDDSDLQVFEKGGALVYIVENEHDIVSVPFNAASMKGTLDRKARWVQVDRHGQVSPSRPPDDVVADLLNLMESPFPRLRAISQTPLVLPDGTLATTNGYDPASGYLLRLNGLSQVRTDMPVDQALDWLLVELLADFPFADLASKTHALALILQPFLMPLIAAPTPMYVIEASTPGTGKGLLAKIVCLLCFDGNMGTVGAPTEEEETRKRLFSLLMESRTLMWFDDVEELRSHTLNRFLTEYRHTDRLMATNRMATVINNATWIATGNNIALSDEMTRRSIDIRMVPDTENPAERRPEEFRHPELQDWVVTHRVQIISAALSIIQHWIDQGMPKGTETMGSFERWARIMGGILDAAGVPGLLENRVQAKINSDIDTPDWIALCEAWWAEHGPHEVRPSDVLVIAKRHRLLQGVWSGRTDDSGHSRFGRQLNRRRDRIYGRFQIRKSTTLSPTSGGGQYMLEFRRGA